MSATAAIGSVFSPAPAGAFADEGLRARMAARPVESLRPNAVLFWEGDPADSVFEIREGVLRLCRLLADGRRAIIGFLFPGDMLGLPCRDAYAYTAEAVTALKVRRLPRAQVLRLVDESAAVRHDLLTLAYEEMCAAQDQMLLLGRKTAEERVATFLLQLVRRARSRGVSGPEYVVPMSRLDMADFLGLTIETVSRSMSRLKGDGIILLPSPTRMVLRDEPALVALAGDEPPARTHGLAAADGPAGTAARPH